MEEDKNKKINLLSASILISAIIVAGAWVYTAKEEAPTLAQSEVGVPPPEGIEEKVLPPQGVALPIRWGDLGAKMVSIGVIDKEKFEKVYAKRGELGVEGKKLLEGVGNEQVVINKDNAGFLLNLFWALGLGAKNDILEKGPMMSPQYGGAGNFASTGGWTLAGGDAMEHYSRHPLIVLTPVEQQLVEEVSKNIYRPCCNNPTFFPDCNHGMAMLGLLELMASQGISEEEMYKVALQVNAYWFPDSYLTLAQYFLSQGISWEKVNPKEVLGANYSSGSGYRKILDRVIMPEKRDAGSCGV